MKYFANRGENTFTIKSAETFVYFVNLNNSEPLAKSYKYFIPPLFGGGIMLTRKIFEKN